jgi:hypothetical protein
MATRHGRGVQTIQRGMAPGSERGTAGLTTGWTIAWGAWLKETSDRGVPGGCSQLRWAMMGPVQMTKLPQEEHEEGQKQEHKHMKYHKDPRRLK